jgi:hypothetical protein
MTAYLDVLLEIRKKLIEYSIKHKIEFQSIDKRSIRLTEDYPIYEMEKDGIDEERVEYHGVTYVNVTNWISYKDGIKIADLDALSIDKMGVCLRFKNGDKIPIEIVIHTFLHELSHTVTIPEKRITKSINKLTKALQSHIMVSKKNSFMPCHHSNSFYKNYASILRMAEKLEIYILPKTRRNFNIKNLQRYDCMFSPGDKLSIGISPLYGS